MKKLTQKRLKEVLNYNKNTGIFTRKLITGNNCGPIGSVVGRPLWSGYLVVGIDGKEHFLHKLVFLYEDGYTPENECDHIDRNKKNNKRNNLREVSRQCNMRNIGNRVDNKSGIKGVGWGKRNRKWRATMKIMGSTKNLGRYSCFVDAVAARLAGEQCLNWKECDGSSPAYQYMQKYLKRSLSRQKKRCEG